MVVIDNNCFVISCSLV